MESTPYGFCGQVVFMNVRSTFLLKLGRGCNNFQLGLGIFIHSIRATSSRALALTPFTINVHKYILGLWLGIARAHTVWHEIWPQPFIT